jgi:hypothetical protein
MHICNVCENHLQKIPMCENKWEITHIRKERNDSLAQLCYSSE